MKEYKLRNDMDAWVFCDLRDLGLCAGYYPMRGAYRDGDGVIRPACWTGGGRFVDNGNRSGFDLVLPFTVEGVGRYKDNEGHTATLIHRLPNDNYIGYYSDDMDCVYVWKPDGKMLIHQQFLVERIENVSDTDPSGLPDGEGI